ncbi:hypothetical protein [Sphingopyxis macrogoltabida]|uniref:Uncharacterized protein n=1 Tax=Sphingopyxis macrogoltabida TaxID=33050 RepID=A0AAC9AX75_SPHMC|nr:hypothetical protein [Sphingopyxis macrogoltabida]ALJ15330.1 hypothetical protein LH19_20845 [Sphingopyxis macrogoltabida]AMU91581.1 hypothetical protein ATM17_21435 [Sphingopyxis macrogoltabida]
MPVIEIAEWRPLRDAPRDGTDLLLVVSPRPDRGYPGYVTLGRWVQPRPENVSKAGRDLIARYGGYWANGKGIKPFPRPIIGWMPIPFFDFEEWAEARGSGHG